MAAVIDEQKCTGCGACEINCPGDIIYLDRERAVAEVRYPGECWFCACCRMECPEDAVSIVFPMSIIP